jgi:hypothetical protein
LQPQTYSEEDDLAHIKWLMRAFANPRYIRVDGRPLFLVYRPFDLPNPHRTTFTFRNECAKNGLPEPYLLGSNSHSTRDCRTIGFDGNVDFEPHFEGLPGVLEDGLKTYDYVVARHKMASGRRGFSSYPCIFVAWDNSPRRKGNAIVFINSTPENFESGLREAVESSLVKPFEDRLVFVNAWNEWAEGNHLENGLGHLEALGRANRAAEAMEEAGRG